MISGKLEKRISKKLAIEYGTKINQKLNKKCQNLTKYIIENKSKPNPDIKKVDQYQELLNEIENYKAQGIIIKSKERILFNEEKPTKYFFLQEKQKQNKRHIKCIQNEQGKSLQKNIRNIARIQNFFPNSSYKTKHLQNKRKSTSPKYFTKCN